MSAASDGRGEARPIRVAIYTDAGVRGGAEHVAGTVVAGLPPDFEVVVAGHEPDLVAWLASLRPGATAVHLGARPTKRRSHLLRLRRRLGSLDCDILHLNRTYLGACLPTLLVSATLPARVVVVDHSAAPPANAAVRRTTSWLSRRVEGRVTVGPQAAGLIERELHLPARSTTIIPNGVPNGRPSERPATAPGRSVTIGTIARLEHGKGIDVLLRAVAALPAVELLVTGEGPERGRIERLAEELRITGRVELRGWSDDPRAELEQLDIFVLASRHEGLPLVLLEAMEAGLPVVATDVGDVRTAVHDGRTGLLVPPDDVPALVDAIGGLAADPARRSALGAAGRDVVQARFSDAAMVEAYADLYRNLAVRRRWVPAVRRLDTAVGRSGHHLR